MGKLKLCAVCLAAVGSLIVASSALATTKTTLPGKTVLVQVLITDQRVIVAQYQSVTLGNGTPGLNVFVGTIPRGEFLNFVVLNRGKKVHDFTVFGKTTKPLKPGAIVRFNKLAKVRGSFPWRDKFETSKAFRGKIVIA